MTDPWDRQRIGEDGQFVEEDGELEPVLWYGRFRDYVALGPDRSVVETCDRWRVSKGRNRIGTAAGAWVRAAQKWHWADRAQAYDMAQLQARWAEDRERYNRMIRRHADLGRGMQTAAARGLQHIAHKAEEDANSLSPLEAVRLAEAGIKAERQAEGLPTELIAFMGSLAEMTDDELADLDARLGLAEASSTTTDDDAGRPATEG